MAWEPSLVTIDHSALGSPEEVRQALSHVFPGTEWNLAGGGEDLVKQMQELGTNISEEWRDLLLQTLPNWHGIYDTEPLAVEFDLGSGEKILFVNITSRGNHTEAQKRLRALASDRGWRLKGDFE